MKIIINGVNGKMGRQLVRVIEDDPELKAVAGIDKNPDVFDYDFPVYENPYDLNEEADIIIDFSRPDAIPGLIDYAKDKRLPVIIATTGLAQEYLDIINQASSQIPILTAANMSLGINIMRDLVMHTSELLADSFDIEIIEKHHNQKVDSPSGTAFALAESINRGLEKPKEYVYGRYSSSEKRKSNEIGIHSIRAGTIAGEHTVIYAGKDEILEISHTALSRQIFATGAIFAAKFLVDKAPGLYDIKDALQSKLSSANIQTSNDDSMITINQLPNEPSIIADIFTSLAEQNINIDMISQTAPVNGLINLSFTLPLADLGTAIQVIGRYNKEKATVRTDVYADITKLTVEGMNMEAQAGVAAKLFRTLAENNIKIKIITTSETKISCVIDQQDENRAMEALISSFCDKL